MAESGITTELNDEAGSDASASSVEVAASKRRSRLWLLVVAHAVLGPLFSIWTTLEGRFSFVLGHLPVVTVSGIVFAQSALLGFWMAFSPMVWWKRLMGLVVGSLYLGASFRISADADGYVALMPVMATGGIAAVCRVVRWRYAGLQRFPQQDPRAVREGLKFSIRGLMLFTFVVAITIVGARELRAHVPRGPNLLSIVLLSVCFMTTGLASVWAGLGVARPMLRSMVVLLIAGILGALFVYSIGQARGDIYFYSTLMMVLQTAVIVASLLVMRSCGYRLVQRSATDVKGRDGAAEQQSA